MRVEYALKPCPDIIAQLFPVVKWFSKVFGVFLIFILLFTIYHRYRKGMTVKEGRF